MPHPRLRHWLSSISLPLQSTLSNMMSPVPCPNLELLDTATATPHPSWRHTTFASTMSQSSSHTVPHEPLYCTSTLPSHLLRPFTSCTSERWAENICQAFSLRGDVLKTCASDMKKRDWPGSNVMTGNRKEKIPLGKKKSNPKLRLSISHMTPWKWVKWMQEEDRRLYSN